MRHSFGIAYFQVFLFVQSLRGGFARRLLARLASSCLVSIRLSVWWVDRAERLTRAALFQEAVAPAERAGSLRRQRSRSAGLRANCYGDPTDVYMSSAPFFFVVFTAPWTASLTAVLREDALVIVSAWPARQDKI